MDFNLIREKWIPVRRRDGTKERIAPWGITSNWEANPVVSLDAPGPTSTVRSFSFSSAWFKPRHHRKMISPGRVSFTNRRQLNSSETPFRLSLMPLSLEGLGHDSCRTRDWSTVINGRSGAC
jgi:hypothetical protein